VDKWSGSRGEGEELKANLHEQMHRHSRSLTKTLGNLLGITFWESPKKYLKSRQKLRYFQGRVMSILYPLSIILRFIYKSLL